MVIDRCCEKNNIEKCLTVLKFFSLVIGTPFMVFLITNETFKVGFIFLPQEFVSLEDASDVVNAKLLFVLFLFEIVAISRQLATATVYFVQKFDFSIIFK